MNICIVGWYGSETLGDRGILAGILKIFSTVCNEINVKLGSIYPFFSERTIYLDRGFYSYIAPNSTFAVFDEKSDEELESAIDCSDIVIMGGGPIMNIEDIKIIQRAFSYAKREKKRTMLFGCGIGPLTQNRYIKIVDKIIKNTDVCLFRDNIAVSYCKEVYKRENDVYVLPDPAIIAALEFKKINKVKKQGYLALNLREFPSIYGVNKWFDIEKAKDLLATLMQYYNKIRLIPMHDFFQGGDDRFFFSKIMHEYEKENIQIIYEPQSLEQLFFEYSEATACIGMRYHAVVFQSILNGNNYILDYTEPNLGKVSGLLIDWKTNFYENRYVSIQKEKNIDFEKIAEVLLQNNHFQFSLNGSDILEQYKEIINMYI